MAFILADTLNRFEYVLIDNGWQYRTNEIVDDFGGIAYLITVESGKACAMVTVSKLHSFVRFDLAIFAQWSPMVKIIEHCTENNVMSFVNQWFDNINSR